MIKPVKYFSLTLLILLAATLLSACNSSSSDDPAAPPEVDINDEEPLELHMEGLSMRTSPSASAPESILVLEDVAIGDTDNNLIILAGKFDGVVEENSVTALFDSNSLPALVDFTDTGTGYGLLIFNAAGFENQIGTLKITLNNAGSADSELFIAQNYTVY